MSLVKQLTCQKAKFCAFELSLLKQTYHASQSYKTVKTTKFLIFLQINSRFRMLFGLSVAENLLKLDFFIYFSDFLLLRFARTTDQNLPFRYNR